MILKGTTTRSAHQENRGVGEFQVPNLCDQELIDTAINSTLASAITAYRGEVVLLLPVLPVLSDR